MPPPAACTQRLIFLFGSFGEGWARASGEALQAAGFGDAIQSRVRWTDLEELTLLAEMAAVGITWEEGTELPWATSFMPFAATVMHRFASRFAAQPEGHCSQSSLASAQRPVGEQHPARELQSLAAIGRAVERDGGAHAAG